MGRISCHDATTRKRTEFGIGDIPVPRRFGGRRAKGRTFSRSQAYLAAAAATAQRSRCCSERDIFLSHVSVSVRPTQAGVKSAVDYGGLGEQEECRRLSCNITCGLGADGGGGLGLQVALRASDSSCVRVSVWAGFSP